MPTSTEELARPTRRRGVLLAAAALTLIAWALGALALYARADGERERVVALSYAEKELHELDAVGWRQSLGVVDGTTAIARASALWTSLRADVEAAGSPALLERLGGTEATFKRAMGGTTLRPDGIGGVSDDVARSLGTFDVALEAELDAVEGRVRRADELARTYAFGGGIAALVLVLGLLRAYVRAARTADALIATSARAEGERDALAHAARRLHALVEHASDCVVVVDADGDVAYATESLRRLLGVPAAAATGRPAAEVLAGLQAERLAGGHAGEVRLRHRAGHDVHVQFRVADRRQDPEVAGLVVTLHDVGEKRRLERALRASESRDAVTGLANRSRFEQWVEQALADSSRLAVVLVGLTDLQAVNESLGYAAGDRCLAECATRLRAVAGPDGRLARLTGNTFALLTDAEPARAERWARTMLEALVAPVMLPDGEVPLTASSGVALAAPGGTAPDLVRAADTALNAAVRRGAGHVELFAPAMHTRARRRLEIRAALTHAVERGELDVAYQPIVDIMRGEPVAVEALVRWQLDGRPVSPADFIPVAEASGLIVPIGARVLERACTDVAEHTRPLGLSVNVSAVQLRSPDFVDTVRRALERSGLEPEALVLELTETAMLDDTAGTRAMLAAARALGVRIALDDFGTGWSSLASLASLPVDILKLDRSFVAAMDGSPSHQALVGGVLMMAERLGVPAVVEGVETEAQLAQLRLLGGQYVQGYHLGRPGPLSPVSDPTLARL